MVNILFVGGGSIGHIAPAVAVWNELRALHPQAEAHFVCSPRPDDSAFLAKHQLKHTVFHAPRASVLLPMTFAKAVRAAKRILDAHKPDIIFSKGGYVSLPLCYAAHKRGIPIVTHESDTVSGYANKIISKWAAHTCTGFPLTTKRKHTTFTGNPIRKEITEGSKKEALRITGFDGEKPILLVSGGSQGAMAINEAVRSMLDDLLLRCDIIHITGVGKNDASIPSNAHYYQTEFAHDELKHLYAAADLAISRAGAGAIGEHAANGIPTILIPLRNVGHDHQYSNAKRAAQSGGCIHMEQSTLQSSLLRTVHTVLTNTEKRTSMKSAIASLYNPDAALQIAQIIVQTLDSKRRDQ